MDANPLRILVVEDEQSVAQPMQKHLRKFGYATGIAHDGKEACRLGEAIDDAAVILDFGLPELDGLLVLRRGIRLDESVPGTGLGLTIVKDITDACGGDIELYEAAAGGLGVRLTLPRAGAGIASQSAGVSHSALSAAKQGRSGATRPVAVATAGAARIDMS